MNWSPVLSAVYLFTIILPVTCYGNVMQNSASQCKLTAQNSVFEYKYYQEGDIIIGGLISAHSRTVDHTSFDGMAVLFTICAHINIEEYRSILAFIFAVDEINKDLDLLPNVTLGYHIYNTCGDAKKTLEYVLQILSGEKLAAPNYSCMEHGKVAGFVGDTGFHTSHAMAQLLGLYRYTQINYRVSDLDLNDKELYPTFHRIVPDDRVRYAAIVKCLVHFGWNWVGIITPGDGSGDMEFRELTKMMTQQGICIEFIIKFTNDVNSNKRKMIGLEKFTARVIIICGIFSINYVEFFHESEAINENMTLILHDSWANIKYMEEMFFPSVNCSLIFILPQKMILNLSNFINNVNPANRPTDPILEDIWLRVFHCLSPNKFKNAVYELVYHFSGINCSGTSHIQSTFHGMKDSKPYYTYTAVYALAHALHKMNLHQNNSGSHGLRQTLLNYMKKLHYTDPTGEEIVFNERGELSSKWILSNWVIYKTGTTYEFVVKPLTSFEESLEEDKVHYTELGEITWKIGTILRIHSTLVGTRNLEMWEYGNTLEDFSTEMYTYLFT